MAQVIVKNTVPQLLRKHLMNEDKCAYGTIVNTTCVLSVFLNNGVYMALWLFLVTFSCLLLTKDITCGVIYHHQMAKEFKSSPTISGRVIVSGTNFLSSVKQLKNNFVLHICTNSEVCVSKGSYVY